MNELYKLKVAYEVILDLETRDNLKPSISNNITVVKNLIANEIAYATTFGNKVN